MTSIPTTSPPLPFCDLIDFSFTDKHLIVDNDFNSFKLTSATFQRLPATTFTSTANTDNDSASSSLSSTTQPPSQEVYRCGDLIGRGSFSKIYTVLDSNNSKMHRSDLVLRLTSSNCLPRLQRELDVLKLIREKQLQSPATAPINQYVAQTFGGGVLPPTKKLSRSKDNVNVTNNLPMPTAAGAGALDGNAHAYSGVHLMERLRPETLFGFVNSHGPHLTALDVYKIMHQCASAVNEIHKLGIVHRDIKPDNFVFDTSDGRRLEGDNQIKIKLIDFGTAACVKVTQENPRVPATDLPQNELNCGTPWYLAPEMARNNIRAIMTDPARANSVQRSQLTSAVDCWALGIIFFSLFTMASPWNAENKAAAVAAGKRNNNKATAAAGSSNPQLVLLDRIARCDYYWPPEKVQKNHRIMSHSTAPEVNQIISQLLHKDALKRMTCDKLVSKLSQLISKVENEASITGNKIEKSRVANHVDQCPGEIVDEDVAVDAGAQKAKEEEDIFAFLNDGEDEQLQPQPQPQHSRSAMMLDDDAALPTKKVVVKESRTKNAEKTKEKEEVKDENHSAGPKEPVNSAKNRNKKQQKQQQAPPLSTSQTTTSKTRTMSSTKAQKNEHPKQQLAPQRRSRKGDEDPEPVDNSGRTTTHKKQKKPSQLHFFTGYKNEEFTFNMDAPPCTSSLVLRCMDGEIISDDEVEEHIARNGGITDANLERTRILWETKCAPLVGAKVEKLLAGFPNVDNVIANQFGVIKPDKFRFFVMYNSYLSRIDEREAKRAAATLVAAQPERVKKDASEAGKPKQIKKVAKDDSDRSDSSADDKSDRCESDEDDGYDLEDDFIDRSGTDVGMTESERRELEAAVEPIKARTKMTAKEKKGFDQVSTDEQLAKLFSRKRRNKEEDDNGDEDDEDGDTIDNKDDSSSDDDDDDDGASFIVSDGEEDAEEGEEDEDDDTKILLQDARSPVKKRSSSGGKATNTSNNNNKKVMMTSATRPQSGPVREDAAVENNRNNKNEDKKKQAQKQQQHQQQHQQSAETTTEFSVSDDLVLALLYLRLDRNLFCTHAMAGFQRHGIVKSELDPDIGCIGCDKEDDCTCGNRKEKTSHSLSCLWKFLNKGPTHTSNTNQVMNLGLAAKFLPDAFADSACSSDRKIEVPSELATKISSTGNSFQAVYNTVMDSLKMNGGSEGVVSLDWEGSDTEDEEGDEAGDNEHGGKAENSAAFERALLWSLRNNLRNKVGRALSSNVLLSNLKGRAIPTSFTLDHRSERDAMLVAGLAMYASKYYKRLADGKTRQLVSSDDANKLLAQLENNKKKRDEDRPPSIQYDLCAAILKDSHKKGANTLIMSRAVLDKDFLNALGGKGGGENFWVEFPSGERIENAQALKKIQKGANVAMYYRGGTKAFEQYGISHWNKRLEKRGLGRYVRVSSEF